jgi:hypothetical protein
VAVDDDVAPPATPVFDVPPALEVDPVAELADVDPVVVAVAGLVWVVVVAAVVVIVGNVTAPYGLPMVVPAAPLAVAVVCAAAGGISATKSGDTKINDLRMRLTTPPPVSHQCCGAEQSSATSAFETA